MRETKSSTGDSGDATRRGSLRLRLLAVGALLLVAISLVIWIRSATWQRVAQLEAEFAAIQSERFLLGLHARESVLRMNAALLRFQLSGDVEEQQSFVRIGRELTNRFDRTVRELTTMRERDVALSFRSAYDKYRAETADMIERSARPIRKDTSGRVHDVIVEKSREVMRLSEELVAAQNLAWTEFFGGSTHALASLRRMLWISSIALLVFASLLALLAYGTFVAPLRAMLTQSQAVIERHEKLASLGTLAAGVAHEIRNPLQAIKMRLFSLNKSLPEQARGNEDLTVISNEINRLEKIVKETLQFARPGEPEMAVVAASDLIGNVADLLGGSLRKRGVQLEGEADKVSVRADRQQIQQVMINLVLNGAESIEGNGVVTMRARADVGKLNGESQPVVRIEVADTGRGVTQEAERRIFDPFFSTKEGGTGLGLAIAARIVEKHGGFIHYSTQVGRGTTFTLVLPRHVE
ncbi:MAG TPA: ATP-binding protein [Candidatus Acidoferrum sp.]|nr:ATP-binding protein [Candidatus Acidoferrum sp.]